MAPAADRRPVLLIATGGTISSRDAGSGAVPQLDAADLAGLVAGAQNVPAVEPMEFARIPGCEMTPAAMVTLTTQMNRLLASGAYSGAVVTHGTDSIEETAFMAYLTCPGDAAVVFTGSMRTASEPSWDGPRNLADALRVAAHPAARGCGALLVMNEQIHSARFVTKRNGLAAGAFESPATGPLGRIDLDAPRLLTRPALPRRLLQPQIDDAVGVVRAGEPETLALLERGDVRGVVVEGFGSGRVPGSWHSRLAAATRRGVAAVLVGRSGNGSVGDVYGYPGSASGLLRDGLIAGHELPAHKARIKLMVALGNRLTDSDLRDYFEQE